MSAIEFKEECAISFANGKATEKFIEMLLLLVNKEIDSLFKYVIQDNSSKNDVVAYTFTNTLKAINSYDTEKAECYPYFRVVAQYHIKKCFTPNLLKLYRRQRRINDALDE